MDIVKRVLEEEQREAEKYKSIEVNKHLETKVDLGYLLCSDPNDLDEKRLKYVRLNHPNSKNKLFVRSNTFRNNHFNLQNRSRAIFGRFDARQCAIDSEPIVGTANGAC